VSGRVPTKVVLYSYASGSGQPAAEFRWSPADGVTLRVLDPDWGSLAERYLADGIYLRAEERTVLPAEGEAFMRALVQPSRSTYSQLVDESGADPDAPPAPRDTGGFTPEEVYRHLAGLPIRPAPDDAPAPAPAATVTPLPARTRDEAQLYMDLRPCERCGSVRTPWDSGLTFVDGVPARSYFGACSQCGRERRFLFRSPDPRELPPSTGPVTFGGAEPSRLVDAGEWLWVADLTASKVPANDPAGARYALSIAAAAMDAAAVDGVLKFVPTGGDAVPDDAFWTDHGLALLDAMPGNFRRD
jgi:hypothetical protein